MLNKHYVFNINTDKFYKIMEKFKELNYIGTNLIEADISAIDFSYNFSSTVIHNHLYINSILNLYTWKIRRDKRIKSLILSLKLMEV